MSMTEQMDNALVAEITRLCLSEFARHYPSQRIAKYLVDHKIGRWAGDTYSVSTEDKRELARRLEQATGVNPFDLIDSRPYHFSTDKAEPGKATGVYTQQDPPCVFARPLVGNRLMFGGYDAKIPEGISISIAMPAVNMQCGHQSIIVCQTFQLFARLEQSSLDLDLAGPNPLVLFAGASDNQREAVDRVLKQTTVPVYCAINLDPEGLLLAMSCPRFGGVLLPEEDHLNSLLESHADNQRFEVQAYKHVEKFVGLQGQLNWLWQKLFKARMALDASNFFHSEEEPVSAPTTAQQASPDDDEVIDPFFLENKNLTGPAPSEKKPVFSTQQKTARTEAMSLDRKTSDQTASLLDAQARSKSLSSKNTSDIVILIPGFDESSK